MTHHTGHHDEAMAKCIQDCLDCFRACNETIAHCLSLGGEHARPDHIALMQSCADVCAVAAAAMARHSPEHAAICAACARVCAACAASCAALGDDAGMRACVESCRRCAESCGKMAA